MNEINLQKISKLISKKLNQEINIVNIEKIGSGYHSDGFKLSTNRGKGYFLKKVKSYDLGFEFPERKVSSLLVSNGMAERSNLKPCPIGVVLSNQDEINILPEINEETEIYHIQEFEKEAKSYWDLLQDKKNKNKNKIDKQDLDELKKVVDYIISIHKIKHPSQNKEQLNAIYNDSLRNVLTHPELTLMLMYDFPKDFKILDLNKQKEYIGLMYETMKKWQNRSDRLMALHGDFWGANLFFKENGDTWVIDYSRIPWGDPGVDIGWWLAQYLWLYHETNKEYFKELGENFLKLYENKTGDKEIRKALILTLGCHGIVYTAPKFFPNLNLKLGEKFLNNIIQILKGGELIWKK